LCEVEIVKYCQNWKNTEVTGNSGKCKEEFGQYFEYRNKKLGFHKASKIYQFI